MRKIGLNLYGPCAKQAMKEEELLRTAKEVGIDFVEPCVLLGGLEHTNPSFWTIERYEHLCCVMREVGLGVRSIHVVTESIEACAEEIQMLRYRYGVEHFVVGMPSQLDECTLRERAEALCRVAEAIEPCGARLLIHNCQPDTATMIGDITALERQVELCGGKVGMQLDLGWCAAGGVDPIALMERNGSAVESLHFKDFAEPGISTTDVAIGSGAIDTRSAIAIAERLGIPMLIDQDSYADVRSDLQRSYDFVVR